MKLRDFSGGEPPPAYISHGTFDGHTFVLHWSVETSKQEIIRAVFRWAHFDLLPFKHVVTISKLITEAWDERRLEYLESITED